MERMNTVYKTSIRPQLAKDLGKDNIMAVPEVKKVTLNIGIGQIRDDKKKVDQLTKVLTKIAGQKPTARRARKSVASFKIRTGDQVGIALTLRGQRMYDFLERFIRIALPRVRDFRGINPNALDSQGNITIGMREIGVFPEVRFEDLDGTYGLEITITTSATNKEDGYALLKALGMPFAEERGE